MIFVPLLFNPEWLTASMVNDSIDYKLTLISDIYVQQPILAAFYATIILVSLLLSSDRYHNILGFMILTSGILT